jgi:hypothetical protein
MNEKKKWRSFFSEVEVPYCHGMTLGELASYFNETRNIGCKLHIAPMTGWKRSMLFHIKAMVPVITPTRAKNRFHSFNSSPRPGFASVPSFPDSVDSLSDPPPPPFVTCGCVRECV